MTTHEAEQLAVLISEVGHIKRTVCNLERRLLGSNGDGLIVRLSLIERSQENRRWFQRIIVSCVALLAVERLWAVIAHSAASAIELSP